jgi:outer membrane lipoprotein SlyB
MKKLVLLLLLAGCASAPPPGPGVLVLPGSGKTFDAFRADDLDCRQYASAQVGGTTAQQAANDAGVRSAAIGTAVGAAAGGLIGGGQGAAVGAGVGLAGGAIAGTDTGYASSRGVQQRYDFGYTQCMYAKGHKVPVAGRYSDNPAPRRNASVPPPPPPPPPQGTPPGTPPDYRG